MAVVFNPKVLVEGKSLLEVQILNDELLGRLEKIFISCLSVFFPGGVKEDELIFNFPLDPSVTSVEIPVAFRVTVLPSDHGTLGYKDEDPLAESLKRRIQEVLCNRPNLLVLVEVLKKENIGIATCG
jgi:hypothetical protein